MKFDVVVGNPPFQSTTDGSKRKKMWVSFAQKSLTMGEYVALITPDVWQKGSKYFSNIGDQIKSQLVTYSDTGDYFNVGENIGYWIVDTKLTEPKIVVKETNPFRPIYEKMLKNPGEVWHYRDFQQPGPLSKEANAIYSVPVYWTAKQTRYAKPSDIKHCGYKVLVNNSGHFYSSQNPEKYSRVDKDYAVGLGAWGIKVDSHAEGQNVLSWVRSKLYRVIVTKMKTGGFNNPFVELKSLGKDRVWTDNEIYQHFNLTDDEINLIESAALDL